jgi:plastocyanin
MPSRILLLAAPLALVALITGCGGSGGDNTAPGVLTSILLIAPHGTIAVGATMQLTADPKDQHGNPVTASVLWASSNTAVATISAGGLVSGLSVGTTTISASSGTVGATPMVVNVIDAGGGFPLTADVFMPGNIYSPFVTDIARTGTVRFVFPPDPHNVIFRHDTPGPPADIDILSNTNVSRTFNTAGTFTYDCTVHPGMTGLIVVH